MKHFHLALVASILTFVALSFPAHAQYYNDPYSGSELDSGAVTSDEVLRVSTAQVASIISGRISQVASRVSGRVGSRRGGANTRPRTQPTGSTNFAEVSSPILSSLDATPRGGTSISTVSLGLSADERYLDVGSGSIALSDGGGSQGDVRGIGTWLNGSWTGFESTTVGAEFDGDVYVGVTGIDAVGTALGFDTDNIILGAALSLEIGRIDTQFNNGETDTFGATLSPYGAYIINDHFYVSALGGVGLTNSDVSFLEANNPETGEFDSRRWYVGASLIASENIDDWEIAGELSYLYAKESADSYNESDGDLIASRDNNLGQISLGARGTYFFDAAAAYASLTYEYENVSASGDVDQLTAGTGLDWYVSDDAILSAEVTHTFSRDDFRSTSGLLNIRFEW